MSRRPLIPQRKFWWPLAVAIAAGLAMPGAEAATHHTHGNSHATPTHASKPAPAPSATPNPGGGKLHITSDYMKYDRKAHMALAQGNVVIVQDDTTIQTAEVQFDQAQKISYMNQPVHLVQEKPKEPRTTLDSQRMTTFHKEKRVLAEGQVRMVRAKDPHARPKGPGDKAKVEASIAKEDTVINADKLEYFTANKDANFTGNVTFLNGQKKAWGDTAQIDNQKNLVTLDGHVKVVQINGNWLIRDHIVQADHPDEARDEALRDRASLTSDHLVIDQNTNDAVATGKLVRIDQKGKVATGQQAVYSDKAHTITLTGDDVRIQQPNGDWLTASKAIFHTDSEVFEAYSGGGNQVHTEFTAPDQKKGSPTPAPSPSGRVQMEFNVNETTK